MQPRVKAPPRGRREVAILSSRALSPSVREIVCRTIDGSPIEVVAGQWMNLHVPTPQGVAVRSYSVASAPARLEPGTFDFAVTKVDTGPASVALHAMPDGTPLSVDGPWGLFIRRHDPALDAAVYVGTGTGLSPLRAMLQEEVESREGPPLVLLFGARCEEDVLWRDEIESWTKKCPRFRYEVTLSRPSAAWRGRSGWVQEHVAELVRPSAPRVHVYVCGLTDMVHDVRRILKEEVGLDRRQIHTERYD